MLLETLVSASEAVQATPKRRQKIGRLAECLRAAENDAALCVAFLCGDLRQGKLGIGYGTLQQGFLETSNVNSVDEITALITAQRAYEMNSKVVSAADQMLQNTSRLGS